MGEVHRAHDISLNRDVAQNRSRKLRSKIQAVFVSSL